MEGVTRIVCYGLGSFGPDREESRIRLRKSFARIGRSAEYADQVDQNYRQQSLEQLGYLAALKEKYRVPVFAYDPHFTVEDINILESMGIEVLADNLVEFVDRTLYYMPFCVKSVYELVWRGHSGTYYVIGNPWDFPGKQVLKKAKTVAERRLYREHYIVRKE